MLQKMKKARGGASPSKHVDHSKDYDHKHKDGARGKEVHPIYPK